MGRGDRVDGEREDGVVGEGRREGGDGENEREGERDGRGERMGREGEGV